MAITKRYDSGIETVLSNPDDVDCGACGETLAGDIAEIYDPSSPDETDIVHADCIPVGWEIA
jgi:hypothetical protein